jgi:hypothetical protein
MLVFLQFLQNILFDDINFHKCLEMAAKSLGLLVIY